MIKYLVKISYGDPLFEWDSVYESVVAICESRSEAEKVKEKIQLKINRIRSIAEEHYGKQIDLAREKRDFGPIAEYVYKRYDCIMEIQKPWIVEANLYRI